MNGERLQAMLLLVVLLAGCTGLRPPERLPVGAMLPARHQVRAAQSVILSDFELPADHPLLKDLENLSEEVYRELRLPPGEQLVYVFLFRNRAAYDAWLAEQHPELPPRRAYFLTWNGPMGRQLRIYSFWGDQVQKDLRHELTHALLHGVLGEVPLWLDEGLAEFFEPPAAWQGINYLRLRELDAADAPWQPNLERLEMLRGVHEMTSADYREAWAWVHYLLRGEGKGRAVLLQYLADLRQGAAGPFAPRLAAAVPNAPAELRDHLVRLSLATRALPTEGTK
jgi:hypothetical protein